MNFQMTKEAMIFWTICFASGSDGIKYFTFFYILFVSDLFFLSKLFFITKHQNYQ